MRQLLVIIMIINITSILSADTYMRMETRQDAFQMLRREMPAKSLMKDIWFNEDKMRMDTGDNTIIIDLENNSYYFIYHDKKQYYIGELPIDLNSVVSQEQSAFLESMKVSVSIIPLEGRKEISGYDCRPYRLEVIGPVIIITGEIWATEDMGTFNDGFYSGTIRFSNTGQDYGKELAGISGVIVHMDAVVRSMGANIKIESRLKKAGTKSADKGHYDVPDGYTVIEDRKVS